MKKDSIVSQIMIIALILTASIVGTYFVSPLFAVLGAIMAITSLVVIVMECRSYQNEADFQSQLNQTETNQAKQAAA